MTSKMILVLAAVAVMIAMLFAFTGEAVAQADDQVSGDTDSLKGADKGLAQKKTVNDSLANRKLGGEDSEGPTRLQMGLGIGSCFVMIAVVKWL